MREEEARATAEREKERVESLENTVRETTAREMSRVAELEKVAAEAAVREAAGALGLLVTRRLPSQAALLPSSVVATVARSVLSAALRREGRLRSEAGRASHPRPVSGESGGLRFERGKYLGNTQHTPLW